MRDTGKSAKLQDALTAAGAHNRVGIIRLDANDAASVRRCRVDAGEYRWGT